MKLNFGFNWQDLYQPSGLAELYKSFLNHLMHHHPEILNKIQSSCDVPLIPTAIAIEQFIIKLFHLESVMDIQYQHHKEYSLINQFKRNFIQRDALYAYPDSALIQGDMILNKLSAYLGTIIDPENEILFAQLGIAALNHHDETAIDLFRQYGAWAYYSDEGKKRHRQGFLFKKPSLKNPDALFPIITMDEKITTKPLSSRDGFDLTDKGLSLPHAIDEAGYCIKCHEREKDTCRKGMKNSEGVYQKDHFDSPLSGCPLDQKISEMNILFEQGNIIAALAVVTLDNPMVAATGHRICYDCSRSCIFQKQDPVDIPSIETRLLKEVLNLPYGFEIYSLLTRWNPLNTKLPYPKQPSGYHVLIVGQGPSGFALAHYLMQLGHQVTAIDGLKIEPLPNHLKDPSVPIKTVTNDDEVLSQRYAKGFGGVAEYGITSRWDKNFLRIIRLLLERRSLYCLLDGVRFGSSMTFDKAFYHDGFDHIAFCLGAGSPTLLPLENITMPGVRLASDFLMALHLGNAAKLETKTSLRIELPVGVVGAGLTAVDAATEALAYYPQQVINIYQRYQHILKNYGHAKATEILSINPELLQTFLNHGKILLEEKQQAILEKRKPNYLKYLNEWGGVTLYYRKKIQNSTSYQYNFHELYNGLQEGVKFVENAIPLKLIADKNDCLSAVKFKIHNQDKEIPLKTLLIAAGTKPNTVLAEEFSELKLQGDFFRSLPGHNFFIYGTKDNRYVSYLGDLHPDYSGSVVKALASAKAAAPKIHEVMIKQQPFYNQFNFHEFISQITQISFTKDHMDVTIKSLAAAGAYRPGQFFKFQPYGSSFTESIPLTPKHVDKNNGTLRFHIHAVGATTRNLIHLKPMEKVYLMGPIGMPFKIPDHHKLLLLVDPGLSPDMPGAMQDYLPKTLTKCSVHIKDLSQETLSKFDSIFIFGQEKYLEAFQKKHANLQIPCYTMVYTHLQCMMKQVCAQCIYPVKDPLTGSISIQFGCQKNIENIEKISYASINKRNNNEKLEEVLLDYYLRHYECEL